MLRKHDCIETGTTIGFRSIRWICFLVAALPLAPQALGVAYVTNDTYTVGAYNTSAQREQLNMYGGTVKFENTGSKGFVRNVIRIDSPVGTDVTFDSSYAATPRPIDFAKDVFNPGGGRLTVGESVLFGIGATGNGYNDAPTSGYDAASGSASYRQSGGTGYPYLAPDAITFTNPGDSLTLTGRVALTAWPTCNYSIASNNEFVPALYGDNMISGDMIVDGVFTLPWSGFNWVNPLCLSPEVKFNIPSGKTVTVHHSTLNTTTGNISYPTTYTQNIYSNDLEVLGTLLVQAQAATRFTGDITGASSSGRINVEATLGESEGNKVRRFCGELSGFNGWLRIYSGGNASWMDGKISHVKLDKSAPGGGIRIFAATNALSMCSFYPEDTAARQGDWTVNRLQADGVYETEGFGLKGAAWYMLSKQHLTVNSLEGETNDKGGLIVIGPTATRNSSTLTINAMEPGMELVISNGVPVTFGSVNGGKIRYVGAQVNTNAVNLAAGCVLGELEVPEGNTVYLNGGAVENVTGNGNLVVTGGDVRLGAVVATVNVQVQGGTVAFGNDVDVSSVLAKSALWLDASDTAKMVGAYNAKWAEKSGTASIIAAHPIITFNGASTATWTNGFPLIEKWFDKRPEQTYNYGWQDRCVDYTDILYTLVYPYLVPNGLNGRAYMSFGEHSDTERPSADGTSGTSSETNKQTDYKCERRRMPIMHDRSGSSPCGNAIQSRATIMVFGSQNGGGNAILGGYNGNARWTVDSNNPKCSDNYTRGGDANFYAASNPIFKTNTKKSVWLDGEAVDPKTTGLNGSWQIVAITNPPTSHAFRSLGDGSPATTNATPSTAGGQNYAEVISFTNAITSAEREAVERYLAMKWGLSNALPAKGPVSVAAGATVKGAVAGVTGDGTWELDLPETTLSMDGSFTGALAGGGVITVADAADMPSLDSAFDGSVNVTGGNLTFTYANGAFTPAIVAPDADLAFPSAPTVAIAAPDGIEPGDYTLVSGKTLAGLDNCVLESSKIDRRCLSLKRESSSLVLRVTKDGLVILLK